jgi:hypothetical protein
MDIEMKITGFEGGFTLYKTAKDIPKERLVSAVKVVYKSFLKDAMAIIEGLMIITEDFINPEIVKRIQAEYNKK